jgi:hypothetical protein
VIGTYSGMIHVVDQYINYVMPEQYQSAKGFRPDSEFANRVVCWVAS